MFLDREIRGKVGFKSGCCGSSSMAEGHGRDRNREEGKENGYEGKMFETSFI